MRHFTLILKLNGSGLYFDLPLLRKNSCQRRLYERNLNLQSLDTLFNAQLMSLTCLCCGQRYFWLCIYLYEYDNNRRYHSVLSRCCQSVVVWDNNSKIHYRLKSAKIHLMKSLTKSGGWARKLHKNNTKSYNFSRQKKLRKLCLGV